MIETEERTIALEKAIEIQVSIIVYTHYCIYSLMALWLTASKSWSCEQQAPTARATLFFYGKGPGCNMPWNGFKWDFTLQWRYDLDVSLPNLSMISCTDETQAELSLSEQLMGDIIAVIREKVPMVNFIRKAGNKLCTYLCKKIGW